MNSISTATGYLVGLDLGERVDYTALSVLRQPAVPTKRTIRQRVGFALDRGALYDEEPERELHYDLTYLDRWRGRGYKIAVPIVERLLEELRQATYQERMEANILDMPGGMEDLPVSILVDHTGVGVAVLEDLRAAGLDCLGITITPGNSVNQSGQDFRVPKKELVSTIKVLVENKRIHGSADLPLWSTLEAEMQNFKAKKKLTTGNDTYGPDTEWREGAHDDLVLSAAMAAWFGEYENVSGIRAPTGALAAYLRNH